MLSKRPEDMGKLVVKFAQSIKSKTSSKLLIEAANDGEAISAFLSEYKDSPETLRSYVKEIERLLLWCIHVADITISGLRREHLLKYQQFLKHPSPKKHWCGPNVGRETKEGLLNSAWRPFVKGLSPSSINTAMKIIGSFFNYLVQTHYLIGNPLALERRKKNRQAGRARVVDRYLELDEIHATLDALSDLSFTDDQQKFQITRARYIILLLFFTGMRISEAANHRMGHFLQRENNWFLRVTGKGKKIREIPVPDDLLAALAEFRLAIGLPSAEPKFRERAPLIPMQNLKQPISARRIDQILRGDFFIY